MGSSLRTPFTYEGFVQANAREGLEEIPGVDGDEGLRDEEGEERSGGE
jgi:hypothetical protein